MTQCSLGLLHGIAYLVLLQECPVELEQALAIAREQSIPLHVAERMVLGATYAEVGSYLLGLWGLPQTIVEAVAFQLTPEPFAHAQFDVLAALLVAHSLAAESAESSSDDVDVDVAKHDRYLAVLHAPFDWREARQRVSSLSAGVDK